ncbi:MAG: sugar phosphate isomerase/epimerase [Actinomycetota bacterium]
MTKVGLMLYTLREECAADFEGTLRAVAEIGYEGVELFDLHGRLAADVRSVLDELGLEVAGRHAGLDAIRADLPELAAELAVLGSDRLVLSWIDPPASAADAQAAVTTIAGAAQQVRDAGLRFGFHNHWAELEPFEDGSVLDSLLALSANELWLELDLGWAWVAGTDPVELLERARGRSPLVHVKDFRSREGREFCAVGDGAVGYDRVLPAALATGIEWLLVEQDETEGSGLDSVARSFDAVQRFLTVAA